MWWKTRRKADSDRLERIEERLRQLEGDFKSIELDWSDTYAKVKRALGRIVKTHAIDHPPENTSESSGDLLTREAILQKARRGH